MCSLKYWQTAFKNHSKEKTGILKAERLKDALLEVGFQLGTDVMSILILRYMRKDGTLRFGDFVSTILHLSVAFSEYLSNLLNYFKKKTTIIITESRFKIFFFWFFVLDVFESKDPLQNGTIKLSLAEWLKSSLTC